MIVIVDDESMELYVEEFLERGLEARQFRTVEEAWHFICRERANIDLIVLDVMMPPGTMFTLNGTAGGLYTGLEFYSRVRAEGIGCSIILLTNRTSPDVEKAVSEDRHASVVYKTDLFYDEFVSLAINIYSGDTGSEERREDE